MTSEDVCTTEYPENDDAATYQDRMEEAVQTLSTNMKGLAKLLRKKNPIGILCRDPEIMKSTRCRLKKYQKNLFEFGQILQDAEAVCYGLATQARQLETVSSGKYPFTRSGEHYTTNSQLEFRPNEEFMSLNTDIGETMSGLITKCSDARLARIEAVKRARKAKKIKEKLDRKERFAKLKRDYHAKKAEKTKKSQEDSRQQQRGAEEVHGAQ